MERSRVSCIFLRYWINIYKKRIFYRLQPKNCQKTFIFKTHKKKDKGPNIEEWVKGLRNHMEKSIGERKNLIELAKTPRFWRVLAFF